MLAEFFKKGLPLGVIIEQKNGRMLIKADSLRTLREAATILNRASVKFSADGLILEVVGASDLVEKNHTDLISKKVQEWQEFKKGKSTGSFRAASEESTVRAFGSKLSRRIWNDGIRIASETLLKTAVELRVASEEGPIRKVTNLLDSLALGRMASEVVEGIKSKEGGIVDKEMAIEVAMNSIETALQSGASLEKLRLSPERYFTDWKEKFDRKGQQLTGSSWESLWLEALTKIVSNRVGSWKKLKPSQILKDLHEGSVEFEVADPFEFDLDMNSAARDNQIQAAVKGILEETAGSLVPADISKNFTQEFLERFYPDLAVGEVWPCILRVSRRASQEAPKKEIEESGTPKTHPNPVDQQLSSVGESSEETPQEVNW